MTLAILVSSQCGIAILTEVSRVSHNTSLQCGHIGIGLRSQNVYVYVWSTSTSVTYFCAKAPPFSNFRYTRTTYVLKILRSYCLLSELFNICYSVDYYASMAEKRQAGLENVQESSSVRQLDAPLPKVLQSKAKKFFTKAQAIASMHILRPCSFSF